MNGVRGILLDSSVVLPSDGDGVNGDSTSLPAADYLLRKLRYSEIPTGLSHEQGIANEKGSHLQEIAKSFSFKCFIFNSSAEVDLQNELSRAWEDNGGSFIHVISSCREDIVNKESSFGWLKVIVGYAGKKNPGDSEYVAATAKSNVFFIDKLEELPLLICHLYKKALDKEVLTVGYVMKPSREEDFAKRGAFPLCPTQNGLIFLPLNYELPISSQLQQVDAVLHKATDEILAVDMANSSEFSTDVTFTRNLQELQRNIKFQTDCCVIDPFNNIFPILDRLKIQQILIGLETLDTRGSCRIRAPRFLKVDSFDDHKLEEKLAEANLSLPNIVKPQVACGVADAHSMAIVFKVNDYKDLDVPLPAVVQEYVDHSSVLYKFYALGSKIFHAVKKSTPNADALVALAGEKGAKPLLFDSLKSLPIAKEQLNTNNQQINLELITEATNWLRKKLDLTIFGFDVVVQEGSGDHVIVDVNYLPSFKEIPDGVAIPAFWDALKEKIVLEKNKLTAAS